MHWAIVQGCIDLATMGAVFCCLSDRLAVRMQRTRRTLQ
jgi:hypothetical protein